MTCNYGFSLSALLIMKPSGQTEEIGKKCEPVTCNDPYCLDCGNDANICLTCN